MLISGNREEFRGEEEERMVCFKFLGVTISEGLKWIANTAAIIKRKGTTQALYPQNTEEDLPVYKSVSLSTASQ